MIALIDSNNFYTSCEKVFRPDLCTKPVVVLSNNDGCIISRSEEARALGIEMGTPFFKVRNELQKKGVVHFSSNYTLYGDMSARVVECIDLYSVGVEVYSVDEAFAELQLRNANVQELATNLRNTILQYVGIAVKIGVAPSKTLAKIAAKYAKSKPNGVFVLNSEETIRQAIRQFPIEKVWGVGRGFSSFLQKNGIRTAYEFSQLNNSFIRDHLGVVGLRMAYELRGISCLPITQAKPARKMIMTSRSFSHPVTTYEEMSESVAAYTSECAAKLRYDKLIAGRISVHIRTFSHRTEQPQNNVECGMNLPIPISNTLQLAKAAEELLAKLYKPGYKYKKAGVLLSELSPVESVQLNLFSSEKNVHQLMNTLDFLNSKYGKQTVAMLSEGIERNWKMKSNFRSNRYTTRWNELAELH